MYKRQEFILEDYRNRLLDRVSRVTWVRIVDNRYLLLLILCMSVYYPVDNSVTNPVDERYKP